MEVRARAPGKIILTGEHAVVHGSTAVAAAIDLYTHVLFRLPSPSENHGSVELELKDLGLVFSWPSLRLEEAFREMGSLPSTPGPCPPDYMQIITRLVRARAPGKIILTGEHAVVHGSTAVAAAIDLYTHVLFRLPSPSENHGSVELELKDLGLVFSWPSLRLEEAFREMGSLPSTPGPCPPDYMQIITRLVEEKNIPEANIALCSGLYVFLYLYTSIHRFKPAIVAVTSELPLGSGLGSSASYCVSLAAALLALSDSISVDDGKNDWLTLEGSNLDLVNKWAFEGEKIIHGKPSGIDNAVSIFGKVLMFKSGDLSQVQCTLPLRMLVTNTNAARNTKALVAGVSNRVSRHLGAMHAVFAAPLTLLAKN
ncbi:hypothetical protein HPP92_020860 [Vanilla planifolia]|uniref:Mevalonate kinase n=1 Tax=Vanilla planifolia TaxID=51239 RepID=A0A835Q0T1_VANPL|nr:hypothetical protein HPP92_020860 [Vanilla planifolia]